MIPDSILGTHNYWAFVLSAVALNIVPGQDTLYIIGRSLAQGRKAGIVSVFGIGTGCLIHIILAALGLYAVLALWPGVFSVITLLGALYLIWLGISLWMSRQETGWEVSGIPDTGEHLLTTYRQGVFTSLFNPMVALFFLAFLPSFVDAGSPYGPLSFLFLGCTFFVTGTIWFLILASCAGAVADTLRGNPKVKYGFDLVASLLFILLGTGIFFFHI